MRRDWNQFLRTAGVAVLLAGVTAGCIDLDVANPMAPDRDEALAEASDLEALISGSFHSWWDSQSGAWGSNLDHMAFMRSGWQGNNGQDWFSDLPRPQIQNRIGWEWLSEIGQVWRNSYRALFAAREGLRILDEGGVDLGGDEPRARAVAHLTQGLAHGVLALNYDQALIVDETVDDLVGLDTFQPYDQVMAAALGYLDQAIAIAEANTFSVPASWMSKEVSSDRLAQIAYAYKARFRTQVARSPEDRAAINWNAVVADIDAAVAGGFAEFAIHTTGAFSGHAPQWRGIDPRWSQAINVIYGMADQSGAYQDWLNTPLDDRQPFLYDTPDLRFPQGTTLEEQRANPGLYLTIPGEAGLDSELGNHFLGVHNWRWSYYRDYRHDTWLIQQAQAGPAIELSYRELRLLRAEALYHDGDVDGAAAIIDETRTANGGLGPAMDNEDCVPRLPDETCGDLFETLKWEQRLETYLMGVGKSYFEARGWGDLPEGTFLHLPVPADELFLLEKELYTFGGAGNSGSAPVGTYGF